MNRRKLILVVIVHVFVLLMFSRKESTVISPQPQSVVVETIALAPPPPPPPPRVRTRPKQATQAKPKPIAKAKPKPKPVAKPKPKPKSVAVKPAPQKVQEVIPDYRRELSELIQLLLRLPEAGMVKVALTLHRSGQVVNIEIVDFESESNKEYVVKMLPALHFQPFGKALQGETEHTFQLTLCGES